jgi:hypothetical protein
MPPSLGEWILGFRKLHGKAGKGQLSASEGVAYYRGRNELAKLLYGLQQLTLQPGQIPRQWIRISHPIQVAIEVRGGVVHATTMDLSLSGFAALLDKDPAATEPVSFVLQVPSGEIRGQARVVESKLLSPGARVAFNFQGLAEGDRERLELFIFDIVLSKLV